MGVKGLDGPSLFQYVFGAFCGIALISDPKFMARSYDQVVAILRFQIGSGLHRAEWLWNVRI